ncbi:MAG: isoleucine--tRNA ligase, partial [bacterium]
YVDRRFGWDCHGLPVEYEVEQDLKVSGKKEIERLGVDVFNESCRKIVLRYTSEWRTIVTRMGRWVDFDNDYKTMDPKFMESIWWVFKSLWDRDLVYEGHKILPYCPRCSTPLSNFETNQGYAEVTGPAITIRFRVKGQPNTYILAWTTTPWTLPSNMGLAVGKDIIYVRVQDKENTYYLAKSRLPAYYKKSEDYESATDLPGSELVGIEYDPLFPYFADKADKGAFKVHAADFVSTEDGTGVVHIAPGFGEDDWQLGREKKIPIVCPVDAEGRFTAEVSDYVGRGVKEADQDIVRRIKKEGNLVHQSSITHSYPHCWRCDTPLIYKAVSTWFVRVEQIRDRILTVNAQTRWVPEHLRDGRFGKWLEQARDWAVSRNRYWGTPLPVWRSEDGKEVVCIGSIEELEKLSGQKITDLHKHFMDKITIPSKQGNGELRRVSEVLDCWFESGSMPYAQAHYPFENREKFERNFPADFIAEGLDQTRGWFYTLMVLSSALFDKPAFKNVVVNGLVLAEDGRKMSKRLKNYPDPMTVINSCGADALRLYMINSQVVKAEDLRFSEPGVKQIMRDLLIPCWNAYSFFVTYANTDGWTPARVTGTPSLNILDRWILSSLESLMHDVVEAMDSYDLQKAVRPFVRFTEDLTNWYIRRSRRRFWKSQDDEDKAQAYETLWYVLLEWSKVAAPFVPFISEAMYKNLKTPDMPESVHLCDFPVDKGKYRDAALEAQMSAAMTAVGLGRVLRAQNDLKGRQPLGAMHIISRSAAVLEGIEEVEDIVLDELNVKKATFSTDESRFATLKMKADFRKLGPRFGGKMKEAAGILSKLSDDQISTLASGQTITITLSGEDAVIEPGDVVIEHIPREGLVVAAQGGFVVALETGLTPTLVHEGMAREFVNKIQNMRKTADFEVSQRIRLNVFCSETLRTAINAYVDYVKTETLCTSLYFVDSPPGEAELVEVNEHQCSVHVMPV